MAKGDIIVGNSRVGNSSGGKYNVGYSRYLPKRLRDRYVEAYEDKFLLSLRKNIALIDAQIEEKLETVESGESNKAWQALTSNFEKYEEAVRLDDIKLQQEALYKFRAVFRSARTDKRGWDDINELQELRRRLCDTERKLLESMQQMISAEKAMSMIMAMIDGIQKAVIGFTNEATARQILSECTAVFGRIITNSNPEPITVTEPGEAEEG